jgi:hypothetical protein
MRVVRSAAAAAGLLAAALGAPGEVRAQAPASAPGAAETRPAVFGKAVISGLGARNIGSATMSGRISALDARNMPDGKVELFVGAASGGV